jgi:hypothetical protein
MIPLQYRKGGSHAREDTMGHEFEFSLYQKVQKKSSYRYPGIIVSIFSTKSGAIRYVVEAESTEFKGMLHIFSEDDLIPRE